MENLMIHPTAEVQSNKIGKGTTIWQYCVVLQEAVIGANCNINCQVFIENNVIIGDRVTIKPGVQVWDGMIIENDVFIGPNATFTNDLYPRSKRYLEKYTKTIIKRGASIGANATIVAGIEIGEYALIGAGSVVTKSVQPHTVIIGNPGKAVGYITSEGKRLNKDLKDNEGICYRLVHKKLIPYK